MKTNSDRKVYRKPSVTSEKVFEQAALACSVQNINTAVQMNNLKNNRELCGFSSS